MHDVEPRDVQESLMGADILISEVINELTKMKSDKSPGLDLVHPKVLKMCTQSLAMPLTQICRTSMVQGNVPTSWKDANVTPIFRNENKKQSSSYRPVNLTSVVCKLLERLIRNRIMKNLDANEILLSDNQQGFIPKLSTTLHLLRVLGHWTAMIDKGDCFV